MREHVGYCAGSPGRTKIGFAVNHQSGHLQASEALPHIITLSEALGVLAEQAVDLIIDVQTVHQERPSELAYPAAIGKIGGEHEFAVGAIESSKFGALRP